MDLQILDVPLSSEAERRYLTYALSVITSRALPDVRDGLKPVQRRILYAMLHDLSLGPDAKPKKCASIVGDVMGKYHPHGDSSIYEALVRMAQPWVVRAPLVYGHGNFGSLDGDEPAAFRYTEARLEKIAMELLAELSKKTVAFRPNFDSTQFEPVVLPARFPNLLVNGSQGIAVGMATSIPPHNLGEVIEALEAMIDDPDITLPTILKKIRAPDFPTGGELISSKSEIKAVYETGSGSLKLRGEWKEEDTKASRHVVITSIPYALEKRALVEKIAEVIIARKLPMLVDIRDESTDIVRIVLEIKKEANTDLVMAYLNKHTPLQSNVQVNLTCLVPSENPDVPTPDRLGLVAILRHFLDFRFEVVTKRLTFELQELERRLHILEGFEKVFDALDEIIKIIRKSEGKADAAEKLMKRFDLDEEQTEAILELKLYRLARLEILLITKEIDEKRTEAKRLRGLLKSEAKRWEIIRNELTEIRTKYADKRRTRLVAHDKDPEFSAEDFIIDEDSVVILTAHGWVKRQQTVRDLSSTRLRDGDRVLACVAGSTRATVAFFSSHGRAYVVRIADLPASTGYGDPVQKLFKMEDGERVVGALSLDGRLIELPEADAKDRDGTPSAPHGVAVTRNGMAFRFALAPHKEPSTRAGRRFARLKEGDEILNVFLGDGNEYVIAAADDAHAIAVDLEKIPVLSGAGQGNILMKLEDGARLIGAGVVDAPTGALSVLTEAGKRVELVAEDLEAERGSKGRVVAKKVRLTEVEVELPEVPNLEDAKPNGK